MKTIYSCLIIGLIFSCQEKKEPISKNRPNIVFIIADDVNWNDVGAYGNHVVRTPNIDQLAKDGMLFTQAFLTTSSCSPSRTSIISGLYPHNTDAEQLAWPLPDGKKTFVKELQNSGYWTGLAGKHHLGQSVDDDFDTIYEMQWKDAPSGLDRRLVGDGSGCDDWVKLLRSRDKDKPFFTWLASFDAHRPFYENSIDNPHNPEDVILPPYHPDKEKVRKDYALYYDEISRLDDYVGKVVSELKRQGVSDNTMILFITDNGRAFPRDKTTLYEGGIKTPWIIKWPAKIKAGSRSDNLISSIDIAPTFMKIAGLRPLPEFEGLNFTALLNEEAEPIRDEIYAEDHFHDFEDYTRAIRTNKYKYIKNFYPDLPNTPSADIIRDLTWKSMISEREKGNLNEAQMGCFITPRPNEELYNILADPHELNNLAESDAHKEVLSDMRSRLNRMRELTNDTLPLARTPDDFIRDTGLPTKYRIRPRPSKEVYMNALLSGKTLTNPDFE
ncbi:heparan N-sulfatase [Maribacter algicola]|uniref:Heparan N-sulfatase n=1 Tax=Maribacter algicola TaxID=2498892 RepID=A0A3R8R362_9FLAO|nr:sulfatase [Maribacter algicola]RRQ49030.1 heparan N-sulfatase [Maribacter algicola]